MAFFSISVSLCRIVVFRFDGCFCQCSNKMSRHFRPNIPFRVNDFPSVGFGTLTLPPILTDFYQIDIGMSICPEFFCPSLIIYDQRAASSQTPV